MKNPTDKGLPAEGVPLCAAECAETGPDAPASNPSATDRTEVAASPSKGGAPKGNTNASKDPAFTETMRALKKAAAEGRSKATRKTLVQGQRIAKEMAVPDTALGDRLARRLSDRETLLDICRGRIKRAAAMRDGSPSPWTTMFQRCLDDDLTDLRGLLSRFLDSAEGKAGKSYPRGPVVIVGDREYQGGDPCPSCQRPIPGMIVMVSESPMISLDAIHAAEPCEDIDAPAVRTESVALPDRATAAREPVASEPPAAPPEPARRLAPGVTLTPGPRRSVDQMLADSGLTPRPSRSHISKTVW